MNTMVFYSPVTCVSRTLKTNETNYGMVEKEVLAPLYNFRCVLRYGEPREIKILTQNSTLAWLVQSSGLNGRLKDGPSLSNWTLGVRSCEKGEDEILGTLEASITPRSEMDEMLIAFSPKKKPTLIISMPPPTVETGKNLLVANFNGSARSNERVGRTALLCRSFRNGPLWLLLQSTRWI